VTLADREESLEQVFEQSWDFRCREHGEQRGMPREVIEIAPVDAPASQTGRSISRATGGLAGVLLGSGVTYGLAYHNGWQPLIPPIAVVGGLAAAISIGALAGLYPSLRAANLSPTDALRAL